MAEPYIKLYKKMLDWEWYDDPNTCRVFFHCLLKANWKSGTWHGIDYKAGELITSLPTLVHETKLTSMQVRVALTHLKATGEITDRRQGNCRIITITKWDLYQGNNRPANKPITDQQQTCNRPVTADKEYKEYKEYKELNNNRGFTPPTVEEVNAYCAEKGYLNKVNPGRFVAFYESKGWFVGKNKMKDWKAAVRNWASREQDGPSKKNIKYMENARTYTSEEWAEMERAALGR